MDDLRIRIDRRELGSVGECEGDDLASDREEVGGVLEGQAEEGRAMAEEVVRLAQQHNVSSKYVRSV
jgi:hypothetical protein